MYIGKAEGCTQFPNARSWKRKIQAQNDRAIADSKHIRCSFIFIHLKPNLPRKTDATRQFASKISSLDVSNGVHVHFDIRTLKTSLITLPPLQTEYRRGPHRHLA